MPLFDRSVLPPSIWPNNRSQQWTQACVDFARRRDPVGDKVHVWLACQYLAMAGLATSAEAITFTMLVGYTLLRAHVLWRAWPPLLTSPISWALAAWVSWSALSLAWSPDVRAGLDTLAGTRGVLLLFALFPLRDRWPLLFASLMGGLALQSCLQIGQAAQLISLDARNPFRSAGLYSHPGHLSTYHATAILIAIAWLRATKSTAVRALLVAVIALCGAGIGIAAGRGAMVALVVAVPVTLGFLLRYHGALARARGRTIGIALGIVVLVAIVLFVSGSHGLSVMLQDTRRIDDVGSSAGTRLVYWQAAIDTWKENPIVGVGVGGTRTAFLERPVVIESAKMRPDLGLQNFAPHQPHSLYLQTLEEGGLVGTGLLVGVILAVTVAAWRCSRVQTIACGVAGALAMWGVAAAFESLQVSGRTASLACVLIAFVIVAPRSGGDSGFVCDPSS